MAGAARRRAAHPVAQVIWLPEALEEVARLYDFLYDKNPAAARKAADSLRKAALTLGAYPDIGVPMEDGVRRELFIPFGSGAYVLRYRQNALDERVIIRVWRTRESRP